MEIITQIDKFNQLKSKDLVELRCQCCQKIFQIPKDRVQGNLAAIKLGKKAGSFCSTKCSASRQGIGKYKNVPCAHCGKNVRRRISKNSKNHSKSNKSDRIFCDLSCSAKYNNAHKKYGCRRSKLEIWMEKQLKAIYPNLEVHYNRKDAINSELDIYVPSLKLAFELNGVFHYEPIYGKEKLESIQNNDNRKFQACIEKGIELCIIDTSKFNYFKEQKAKEFLNIVINIINPKLI